jgi:hypothetical protein
MYFANPADEAIERRYFRPCLDSESKFAATQAIQIYFTQSGV